MSITNEEEKSFLDSEHDGDINYYNARGPRGQQAPKRQWHVVLVYSALAISLSVNVLQSLVPPSKALCQGKGADLPLSYSPANDAIEYEIRNIWNFNDTFMGKPSPETEAAWDDLMRGTLISISEEELEQFGAEFSIPLRNGGYAAGLGTSHSMHCLRRIKKYMYKEHYYGIVTEEKGEELRIHAEHCLEGLRQAMMCYVDPSLLTMAWENSIHGNPGLSSSPRHKCVNYKVFREWMLSREVEETDMYKPDGSFYIGH